MSDFAALKLAKPILERLENLGHTAPTPIQRRMIPELMNGEDVIGIAQTGTGKTGAYLLPLIHGISEYKPKLVPRSASILVMVPTRELAAQVELNAKTYAKGVRIATAVITGGVKPGPQERAMSRGVDILIATPGRLEDHMSTGAINLNGITVAVLDEADQMLDLGFFPAIKRVLKKVTNDRQTILLSATMPPKIRGLASEFLTNPKEVEVARQGLPVEQIDQHVIHVLGSKKRETLAAKIEELNVYSAMVFVRTKRGADRVAEYLSKQGIESVAIHGDLRQGQRDRALAAFKKGKARVMVATDVAARGLDITGVSHVFNFELPNTPESYVHRIGRTGRAGADGMAISFCDATERAYLRDIEKLINRRIPQMGEPIGVDLSSKEEKPPRRGARPGITSKKGRPSRGKSGGPGDRRGRDDGRGRDDRRGGSRTEDDGGARDSRPAKPRAKGLAASKAKSGSWSPVDRDDHRKTDQRDSRDGPTDNSDSRRFERRKTERSDQRGGAGSGGPRRSGSGNSSGGNSSGDGSAPRRRRKPEG